MPALGKSRIRGSPTQRDPAHDFNLYGSEVEVMDETFSHDDSLDSFDDSPHATASSDFVAKQCFPEPVTQIHTIDRLMELLENQRIDIDPDYQREVVWPQNRMSGLIDSLFENCYIPPVVFNKEEVIEEAGEASWTMTCVDGKQRLSSIRAFVNGEIPCHDRDGKTWFSRSYEATVSRKGPKRRPRVLSASQRTAFMQKRIVCVVTAGLSKDQEEDVFSRVQLGIPLSLAEKLRATSGEWQELAKLYEKDFASIVGCKFEKYIFF